MSEESQLVGRSGLKVGPYPDAPAALARHPALWVLLAAGLLALAAVLPLWTVRYVPLYDYQNHLLEAKVVVEYGDPQSGYAAHYQIRPGWYWQSNALSTLLVAGLARFLPVEVAGRVVLSLYVVGLAGGIAALIWRLKRSPLLLLALPPLIYNFTFTSGLLNWSLGLALLVWSVLAFLIWADDPKPVRWLFLALGMLLAYMAHVMAWGLLLVVIYTLLVLVNKPVRMHLAVLLASLLALPMLLVSRPLLALAPFGLAVAAITIASVRRRIERAYFHHIRHPPYRPVGLTRIYRLLFSTAALGGALGLLVVIRLAQVALLERFPDVGYSSYAKARAFPHLFTLPYHAGMVSAEQGLYNTFLLVLICALIALFTYDSFLRIVTSRQTAHAEAQAGAPAAAVQEEWNENIWLGVAYTLLLAFLVIPTRTADIIATEPRVLLAAFILVLPGLRIPAGGMRRALLIAALLVLAVSSSAANWIYTHRYDETAQSWAARLAEIPPGQRVLVFTHPQPAPQVLDPRLLDLAQFFDLHQFASTYALERGGFVSNTFFNGPLLPFDEDAIPPYWWSEFTISFYLEHRCSRMLPAYDYVMVWNLSPGRTRESLEACFNGPPDWTNETMTVWKLE